MQKQANTRTRNSTKSSRMVETEGMESSQLMKLFEDELKDIYWAEKALTIAIPKMIKNATSTDLKDVLDNHLSETQEQVTRLENVFGSIDKKAVAKKCEAMDGLIKEGNEIIGECDKGAMRDAGIISAAQKIEHYEISAYGTLRQFAETLELSDAIELLEQTLNEEKSADEKLTEVAVSAINLQANEKDDDAEEESEEDALDEDDSDEEGIEEDDAVGVEEEDVVEEKRKKNE